MVHGTITALLAEDISYFFPDFLFCLGKKCRGNFRGTLPSPRCFCLIAGAVVWAGFQGYTVLQYFFTKGKFKNVWNKQRNIMYPEILSASNFLPGAKIKGSKTKDQGGEN